MDFHTTIESIMSDELTTVQPHSKLVDFEHLFQRRGIHHLPVEDEDKRLVGIISTEDVNRSARFFANKESIMAQHIMTAQPTTIVANTSIIEAVKVFMEHKFRALPVVDKADNFVGIITPYDLMREMMNTWYDEKEMADMEDEDNV